MEQHNDTGNRRDLAQYRVKRAIEDLRDAQILYQEKSYCAANNRAYYAIFHMISAVHALDGNQYKKHKDAIASFNKLYIHTEIFPREYGRKIAEAEEIRHASDYDDFYVASKEETEEQIETAEALIILIKKYVEVQ